MCLCGASVSSFAGRAFGQQGASYVRLFGKNQDAACDRRAKWKKVCFSPVSDAIDQSIKLLDRQSKSILIAEPAGGTNEFCVSCAHTEQTSPAHAAMLSGNTWEK
jgi:hypothetical protein